MGLAWGTTAHNEGFFVFVAKQKEGEEKVVAKGIAVARRQGLGALDVCTWLSWRRARTRAIPRHQGVYVCVLLRAKTNEIPDQARKIGCPQELAENSEYGCVTSRQRRSNSSLPPPLGEDVVGKNEPTVGDRGAKGPLERHGGHRSTHGQPDFGCWWGGGCAHSRQQRLSARQ
jgi:hypothetical protein